jgi:putative oxidoreductase
LPETTDMKNSAPLQRFSPELLGVLRIVAGLLFMEHGLAKLFGFPPGVQPSNVVYLSQFGLAGVIEALGGLLILLGLFSRTAAFIASGEMALAYWMVHAQRGVFPAANGGDAAILYCFIFLYLAAAGPGAFSIDGRRLAATRAVAAE